MSIQTALAVLALAAPQDLGSADQWTQEELEAVTDEIRVELEELRGDKFLQPVQVKITDKDGLLAYLKQRIGAFTTPEQWVADSTQARLLGLIPADLDLLATTYSMLEGQVGGFYDPASSSFYLMDSFTGGMARVILSHELVHALDDQLFDLDAGMRDRLKSADAGFAYQALCEGSAQLISMRWVIGHMNSLSPSDLEQASLGTESLAAAPAFLWKPLLAAYMAGNNFLDLGYRLQRRELRKAASQSKTIAAAFASPPRSSEQVLHPSKYWNAESLDEPIQVSHGTAPEGWTERSRTTLGELILAILVEDEAGLAAPDLANPRAIIGLTYTNSAAEGWGGDEVVLLSKDGADVVHLATVWDTEPDAQEFYDALKRVEPRIRAVTAALSETSGMRIDLDERRVTMISYTGTDASAVDELITGLPVTITQAPALVEAEELEPAGAK